MNYYTARNVRNTKLFRSIQPWRIYPYGKFIEQDGSEVIFDRQYRPICRVFSNGSIEIVPPTAWICFESQEWFYNDLSSPRNSRKTRKTLMSIIDKYDLKGELLLRRELEKQGFLPTRAIEVRKP